MISLRLSVKKMGNDELAKLLKKIDRLQVPMRQAGEYMERETKLNFARQSDPDGKPWAPLKPSTRKRKRGRAILRESSTLVGGISLTSVSNSSATIAATAGSEYGIYHSTGTSKMARRQFIGIGDRHIPKITQIFEKYLEG
ncbi:MAG: phage virion morphogenesis protein [Oculatellaceae cyanobacterium bins.114]|nr:phage virion morphogenesis protein [Oculatellaceae cyanobacterium bins.114]